MAGVGFPFKDFWAFSSALETDRNPETLPEIDYLNFGESADSYVPTAGE